MELRSPWTRIACALKVPFPHPVIDQNLLVFRKSSLLLGFQTNNTKAIETFWSATRYQIGKPEIGPTRVIHQGHWTEKNPGNSTRLVETWISALNKHIEIMVFNASNGTKQLFWQRVNKWPPGNQTQTTSTWSDSDGRLRIQKTTIISPQNGERVSFQSSGRSGAPAQFHRTILSQNGSHLAAKSRFRERQLE